jgi:hypothetical protein
MRDDQAVVTAMPDIETGARKEPPVVDEEVITLSGSSVLSDHSDAIEV